MIHALIRIVCNAIALYVTSIVPGPPGIVFNGNLGHLLLAGAILGLFNLVVRPIAVILSLPFLILTLGLFYFVLNGILLWVAGLFLPGYHVHGLFAAMVGALVMMVVNWLLHLVVGQ